MEWFLFIAIPNFSQSFFIRAIFASVTHSSIFPKKSFSFCGFFSWTFLTFLTNETVLTFFPLKKTLIGKFSFESISATFVFPLNKMVPPYKDVAMSNPEATFWTPRTAR